MKNLFFYGTLRHIPLLEVLMGRPAGELQITTAQLSGYAVSAVAEGPFPMISEQTGALAEGVLVGGLSDVDMARLDFYEGSFAYDLRSVTLDDGQLAEVYVPQAGLWTADGPWSLAQWERDWGEMSVIAAREVMGYFGQRSGDEVAEMFPVIRARAASELRARASLHGADTFDGGPGDDILNGGFTPDALLEIITLMTTTALTRGDDIGAVIADQFLFSGRF